MSLFDKGHSVDVSDLDFYKAIDLVPHDNLIKKTRIIQN